jgi:hypothetical protein
MAGAVGDSADRTPIVSGVDSSMRESTCRDCKFFIVEPRQLEEAIPGLRILSSAFGSVRADTALCDYDGVFITAMPACRHFHPKDTGCC